LLAISYWEFINELKNILNKNVVQQWL